MGEKREALAMVITCPQWSSAGALLWLSLCGAISRLLPLKYHFERAKALSTGGQIFQIGFTIMSKTAPCFPFFPGSGLSEVMDEMARFFRLIIDEWKYQRKFGQETSVLYIYIINIYIYLNKKIYIHININIYIYIHTYVRTYIHSYIHIFVEKTQRPHEFTTWLAKHGTLMRDLEGTDPYGRNTSYHLFGWRNLSKTEFLTTPTRRKTWEVKFFKIWKVLDFQHEIPTFYRVTWRAFDWPSRFLKKWAVS